MKYWPYLMIFLVGCTYLHIEGDYNTVDVEKVGTDVDTDAHLNNDEIIKTADPDAL